MIKIIYGEKGTGKTKCIIEKANEVVSNSKGNVIFLTDIKRYMFDLVHKIRLIEASDYDITNEDVLTGFIRGLCAGDNDIQFIFIDGASRMAQKSIQDMENFYLHIDKISKDKNISFYLTVSADGDKLPRFMKKYI